MSPSNLQRIKENHHKGYSADLQSIAQETETGPEWNRQRGCTEANCPPSLSSLLSPPVVTTFPSVQTPHMAPVFLEHKCFCVHPLFQVPLLLPQINSTVTHGPACKALILSTSHSSSPRTPPAHHAQLCPEHTMPSQGSWTSDFLPLFSLLFLYLSTGHGFPYPVSLGKSSASFFVPTGHCSHRTVATIMLLCLCVSFQNTGTMFFNSFASRHPVQCSAYYQQLSISSILNKCGYGVPICYIFRDSIPQSYKIVPIASVTSNIFLCILLFKTLFFLHLFLGIAPLFVFDIY